MPHLTTSRHPDYKDIKRKAEFAWDHYTGRYVDDDKIHHYLYQKEQRETAEAYQERQDLTDPVLHFPTAVDSLNGIASSNEDDINRDWGDLGDPEEPTEIAYRLKNNADGEGMNWNPLMKQVGIRLTVMHKIWGLVEGLQDDEDGTRDGSVKLINPQSVVDWYPKQGPLKEVLVQEERDARTSISDTEALEDDIYVHYTLDGWTRYKVHEYEEDGEMIREEVPIGSGEYEYYASTESNSRRILPIFYTEIPMPRPVGYLLSKKQNHIFNQESRRDFALGNMSFAIGVLAATDDQYQDFLNDIKKGFNWLRQDPDANGEHRYMSPDPEFLTEFKETLNEKKKDFFDAAFKQYGDAAKQVTATEIRLESRSGIEAFLSLLVTSIDEFENDCLWRLTQVYFPDNRSAWGSARVERSKEFQPEDVKDALEKLSSAVLNADRAQAISTYTKVKMLHPEWTDEQIEEEVQRLREEQGAQPIPSEMIGD